jgi:hypothetical protein
MIWKHTRTTAPRFVTGGKDFLKETRGVSENEFKRF